MTPFFAWAVFTLAGPPDAGAPVSASPSSPPASLLPAGPKPRCTAFAALTRTATVERDMAWREARLVARTVETTDVAVQTWAPRPSPPEGATWLEVCREGARRFCEAQGAAPADCRFTPHDETAAPSWDTASPVVPPPPPPAPKPKKPRSQKRRNVTTP